MDPVACTRTLKKWINDFHSKTDMSLVNIALGSGEPIPASMKTSNLFSSLGLHPLQP